MSLVSSNIWNIELTLCRRSFFRMQPGSKLYLTQWMHDIWRNKFLFCAVMAGIVTLFPILYIPVLNTVVFKHRGISWVSQIIQVQRQTVVLTSFSRNGPLSSSPRSSSLVGARATNSASESTSDAGQRRRVMLVLEILKRECLHDITPPTPADPTARPRRRQRKFKCEQWLCCTLSVALMILMHNP